MNNILNIKTPAEAQASALEAEYGLQYHGLTNLRKVYWNLPTEALYEEIVFRGEGRLAANGAIVVNTGKHTARAARDKFVVREAETEDDIWWGEHNRPFDVQQFEQLFSRMQGFMQGRDLFVQDCYAGADPAYRLPVRIITEYAWHSLFARNMFIPPQTAEEYRQFVPEFVVISLPSFQSYPQIDALRSQTFIVLSFAHKMTLIGNTGYAGEIKKSVFTALNYLLPKQGVMSMHCSANVNPEDHNDVALFFGLSGTGKTTLSADPSRQLIGDDEHGWSDDGIFNYENGCYAKVINLSPSAEPQIYRAIHRFGAILENVVMDPASRLVDLDDDRYTENTRASYPLLYIDNALPEKKAGHPRNIVFLTCDAQGVMPPIARLSLEQAMYQFISGYTSKVGGTEVGLGQEPELTFSACFGAPFMVHHPYYYAQLLRHKIERYNATCWLVNTGWVGGPYGVGKRISIRYTRTMLNAALRGDLDAAEYRTDPIFGFQVPLHIPGIPDDLLNPAKSWPDETAYWRSYRELAARFIENFKKFTDIAPPELTAAGPQLTP